MLMKQYHLLPDQSGLFFIILHFSSWIELFNLGTLVQPLPKSDHVVSFTDADELLRDNELMGTERDEILENELAQNDR